VGLEGRQLLRPRGSTARHDPEPPAADARARRDGTPRSITEQDLRDRKVEALRAVVPPKPRTWRRPAAGRYTEGSVGGKELPSYADAEGVDPERTRDLCRGYVPPRELEMGGTPFRLRTGKAIGRSGGRSPCISGRYRTNRSTTGTAERPALHPLPRRHRPGAESQRGGRPLRPGTGVARHDFPVQELPPYSLLSRRSSKVTRRCPSEATRPKSCGASSSRCCRHGSATTYRWRSTRPDRAARRVRRPLPGAARGGERRQGPTRARADGAGRRPGPQPPHPTPASARRRDPPRRTGRAGA
jgi:hypothetical protein